MLDSRLAAGPLVLMLACGGAVDINVQILDPCNQDAVQSVDFLQLDPRGEGIDDGSLGTTVEVASGAASAIQVPLASDFHLVVTGHKAGGDLFEARPSAIGVSAKYDLTNAEGPVNIKVPFALVDQFYKTTSLDADRQCSRLNVARFGATATFLPANGKVLIVGGVNLMDASLSYPRNIEIYDPSTGSFEAVAELKSGGGRAYHSATLLADGTVLIAGGQAYVNQNPNESVKSALIIDARDPGAVVVSDRALTMRAPRTGHVAQRLADGRVVLIGGRTLNPSAASPDQHTYLKSVEIYDPDQQAFTFPTTSGGGVLELSSARFGHSGTLLKTGFDVLVAGGENESGPVLTLEVLRFQGMPRTVTSSATLGVGAIFHAADLAQNEQVLIAGGYTTLNDAETALGGGQPQNASANVEMWEFRPATSEIVRACSGTLTTGRGLHTVTTLGRRAVFVGGRDNTGRPMANGEVADLVGAGASCFARVPTVYPMSDARAQHSTARLEMSGEVLVVGGRQQEPADPFGRSIASAEVFSPLREP